MIVSAVAAVVALASAADLRAQESAAPPSVPGWDLRLADCRWAPADVAPVLEDVLVAWTAWADPVDVRAWIDLVDVHCQPGMEWSEPFIPGHVAGMERRPLWLEVADGYPVRASALAHELFHSLSARFFADALRSHSDPALLAALARLATPATP